MSEKTEAAQTLYVIHHYLPEITIFTLLKETEHFYIVVDYYGRTNRVSKSQGFHSKADAWRAHVERRNKQIGLLEKQIQELRGEIAVAERELATATAEESASDGDNQG
jgi:hypothetical protein